MFAAFQQAILQSNAFQTLVGAFTPSPTPVDTHDVGRYRKRIEKLSRIADEREKRKFVKEAKKLQKTLPQSAVESKKELQLIVEEIKQPEVDFDAISRALIALVMQLESELARAIHNQNEEEAIILLLLA